jgi:hypothetical protein
MQYLLMCCFDEKEWDALPRAQRDELMRDYGAWIENSAKTGHYLAGAKLQATASATTLRGRGGKPVITDGPFAETKEQLGGYHVLDCKDLDEALAIASRIPTLRVGGTIEVRPLDYTTPSAGDSATSRQKITTESASIQ